MLKRLSTILAILIVTLTLVQCQKPSYVLNKKEMTAVTKDMLLADAYLQQHYEPDSIAALYYESILDKHKISREQYDSSLVWYTENSYRLADIYDIVGAELNASKDLVDTLLSDSIQRYRTRFEGAQDQMHNLWSNSTRLYIPSKQMLWSYTQSITPEEPFNPLDTLLWKARIIGDKPDTLELSAQLLIVTQEGYRYKKIGSTPTLDKERWEASFVLPDSMPSNSRFTLLLVLKKSRQSLYLQHLSVGKPSLPDLELKKPDDSESQTTDELSPEAVSPVVIDSLSI